MEITQRGNEWRDIAFNTILTQVDGGAHITWRWQTFSTARWMAEALTVNQNPVYRMCGSMHHFFSQICTNKYLTDKTSATFATECVHLCPSIAFLLPGRLGGVGEILRAFHCFPVEERELCLRMKLRVNATAFYASYTDMFTVCI